MLARLFAIFTMLWGAAAAQPLAKVKVAVTNSATDVGFFIAHKKGYYAREGIDAEFVVFDSAARMIAPLASGELDVGAGGISAGLYNAVARGIDIRMVADKNSTPPGRASTKLLIRKELIDSGRYRTLPDIKGMKLANSAPGGSGEGTLKPPPTSGSSVQSRRPVRTSQPPNVESSKPTTWHRPPGQAATNDA